MMIPGRIAQTRTPHGRTESQTGLFRRLQSTRGVLSGAIWQDTSIEITDDVGRVILWTDIYFSADRPEHRPALN
jgi:hypothetical protein